MKNIRLIISYDGTSYHGWQCQPNAVTIQETIQTAIKEITGETVTLAGAGRTDSGVHALGQVAAFKTESSIPPSKLMYPLNDILPSDIVILKSEEVDMDFHPRFSAHRKRYKYVIYNSEVPSPIYDRYSAYVPRALDADRMAAAAKQFMGEHDFFAFMASGSEVKDTVRTIFDANVMVTNKPDGKIIEFDVYGNGFLYNMVRIMAGTLIEIGQGKREGDCILQAFKTRDRRKLGRTAPAKGLFMCEIYY